jgi:hypothetical protein
MITAKALGELSRLVIVEFVGYIQSDAILGSKNTGKTKFLMNDSLSLHDKV